jgi:GNAT superfamily N-acetyltransferase
MVKGANAIKDPYYNFFAPESALASLELPPAVTAEFTKRGRQPAIYLTPLSTGATEPDVPAELVWAQDAWMVGETAEMADPTGDEPMRVNTIDETDADVYVSTFAAAYSGEDPDDPYGQLDQAYVSSLRESFRHEVPGYRKYYLLAVAEDEPVGVAAMFTSGDLAGVYGVGTVPSRRRAGVGRTMMAHLAAIARDDGVSTILLQTEAGSAVQQWYSTLGYRHVFTAAYVPLTDG